MVGERGGLSGPTRENERIILLDALRGFALLGVLLANLRDLTLFNFLPESGRAALNTAASDHWLDLGMAALVDAKAFTIFTLLFGVGFALQAERAAAAGAGLRRYARRLLVLFVIGLAHAYLFWWGDILRLYALLGFFLMPAARIRPRTLVILGVFVAVFVTPFLRPMMGALLPPIHSSAEASAAALNAFQGPSLTAMWKANFAYDTWTRISAWGLPFYVLGRLLIGAAIGRSGLLRDPQRHRRLWLRLFSILFPLGLALTAFILLRDHGAFGPMQGWWRAEPARGLVRIARSGASLTLGLAYVALFVLLFQRPGCRRWLEILAPIGRMALTHYILQTILALLLFYGVGFRIGPRFGLPGVLIATLLIFSAQLVASRCWLQRFQFGPLEWIWRSLTYGRPPPMRRA